MSPSLLFLFLNQNVWNSRLLLPWVLCFKLIKYVCDFFGWCCTAYGSIHSTTLFNTLFNIVLHIQQGAYFILQKGPSNTKCTCNPQGAQFWNKYNLLTLKQAGALKIIQPRKTSLQRFYSIFKSLPYSCYISKRHVESAAEGAIRRRGCQIF